jgi:2-dehydro-3-deoxyphosphogluconate aldolase / (4S)-4-hydroxy-2-oxoglutarate aldolase
MLVFTKLATLSTIQSSGAVLIIRLPDANTAESVAHAAIEGGFRALEITLSIPGAVDLIHRLAAQYTSQGVAVGAGTVLDGHAAYECIRAGATFLVSPQLNPEMIRVANRYQLPTISGAFTPTEILESVEAGADMSSCSRRKTRASRTPRPCSRRWRTCQSCPQAG